MCVCVCVLFPFFFGTILPCASELYRTWKKKQKEKKNKKKPNKRDFSVSSSRFVPPFGFVSFLFSFFFWQSRPISYLNNNNSNNNNNNNNNNITINGSFDDNSKKCPPSPPITKKNPSIRIVISVFFFFTRIPFGCLHLFSRVSERKKNHANDILAKTPANDTTKKSEQKWNEKIKEIKIIRKKTERKQQPNVCTSYGRPFWASDIKIQHRKSRFVFFVFFSSLPIDFNPPTTTQKGYYGFDSTY